MWCYNFGIWNVYFGLFKSNIYVWSLLHISNCPIYLKSIGRPTEASHLKLEKKTDLFQAAGVLCHLTNGCSHVHQQTWPIPLQCQSSSIAMDSAPGLVLAINLITGPSPSCSRISSLQCLFSSDFCFWVTIATVVHFHFLQVHPSRLFSWLLALSAMAPTMFVNTWDMKTIILNWQ